MYISVRSDKSVHFEVEISKLGILARRVFYSERLNSRGRTSIPPKLSRQYSNFHSLCQSFPAFKFSEYSCQKQTPYFAEITSEQHSPHNFPTPFFNMQQMNFASLYSRKLASFRVKISTFPYFRPLFRAWSLNAVEIWRLLVFELVSNIWFSRTYFRMHVRIQCLRLTRGRNPNDFCFYLSQHGRNCGNI